MEGPYIVKAQQRTRPIVVAPQVQDYVIRLALTTYNYRARVRPDGATNDTSVRLVRLAPAGCRRPVRWAASARA